MNILNEIRKIGST